jgi:hypothetical protein
LRKSNVNLVWRTYPQSSGLLVVFPLPAVEDEEDLDDLAEVLLGELHTAAFGQRAAPRDV